MSRAPGPDAAILPAVAKLAEIPGVSENLARAIIAGTGLDMTRFPTAGHLVSWAGRCLGPPVRSLHPVREKGQGDSWLLTVAEDKRFELLRGCPQHAFQACALGH